MSVAVAIAGGVAGLYVSYYAGTAGGASIALCLVGAYLAALRRCGPYPVRPSGLGEAREAAHGPRYTGPKPSSMARASGLGSP